MGARYAGSARHRPHICWRLTAAAGGAESSSRHWNSDGPADAGAPARSPDGGGPGRRCVPGPSETRPEPHSPNIPTPDIFLVTGSPPAAPVSAPIASVDHARTVLPVVPDRPVTRVHVPRRCAAPAPVLRGRGASALAAAPRRRPGRPGNPGGLHLQHHPGDRAGLPGPGPRRRDRERPQRPHLGDRRAAAGAVHRLRRRRHDAVLLRGPGLDAHRLRRRPARGPPGLGHGGGPVPAGLHRRGRHHHRLRRRLPGQAHPAPAGPAGGRGQLHRRRRPHAPHLGEPGAGGHPGHAAGRGDRHPGHPSAAEAPGRPARSPVRGHHDHHRHGGGPADPAGASVGRTSSPAATGTPPRSCGAAASRWPPPRPPS